MEELQDAIEDAQYVNAIATQDDGPRPVLPWDIPNEEQLAEWEKDVKSRGDKDTKGRSGEPFSYEWYLSSAVGFFLFSAYLKEEKNDYVRINFVEDVLRFKKLRGRQRIDKLRSILTTYLQTPKTKSDTGEFELPPKTEIDEFDLDRQPRDLSITEEQFQALCESSLDSENLFCCIGIKGALRDDLIAEVKEKIDKTESMQKAESVPILNKDPLWEQLSTSSQSEQTGVALVEAHTSESMRNLTKRLRSESASDLPGGLFDKAEAVVMEGLRREYWESFLESERFKKLRNFLWYQDRQVVPEDFFVMRVLGRGGFGLVTGMFVVALFDLSV